MKRYLGIISLIYIGIILYVYFSGNLDNYLSPNMQWYIVLSLVFLVPMTLALLINDNINYKFKISDLFLLLPLIMIIVSGGGRLTTNLASNRSSNIILNQGTVVENEEQEQEVNEIVIEEPKEEMLENIDFEVVDESYSYLANLMMTTKNIDKFIGKTIKLKGFTMTNLGTLPEGYFAIGKYEITCCAADAGFTGWIARSKTLLENDKWYEVEGIIEKVEINNSYFISVNIINSKEIDGSKEKLYVYPCFSYDNGNCDILKNYDLS